MCVSVRMHMRVLLVRAQLVGVAFFHQHLEFGLKLGHQAWCLYLQSLFNTDFCLLSQKHWWFPCYQISFTNVLYFEDLL